MGASKRIWSDLVNYGRSYTRSRIGLFFGLAFPVILILLFGAIFSGGSSGPIHIYAQNEDKGQVGTQFLGALNQTGVLQVSVVPNSQNFSQYLLSHSTSDGLVVPANFSSDYAAGRPLNITEFWNPSTSTSQEVSVVVGDVVNAFNLHGTTPILQVKHQTIVSQSYTYIDFLIPGMIGFAILVSPMFALVNISSQYKRDKIFKQLSLTPLTKTDWLLAKIGFYIIMTCASFLLMSAFGIVAFGAHIALTPWIIPFLLIGPFMFVSLGMLVGTVSTSVESAAVVGNLITFPMMFLSGTFFPVTSMPLYLQNVAHVLPLFYVIDGLNNVMIYGNYSAALYDLAILLVVSAVFFVLAVRFFKWRED
ncbi:MAG: ABC transporter permease [Nitrososphaerota archaeon]|nr:ABC transporter permease [Nitrososphaerota archaeon]